MCAIVRKQFKSQNTWFLKLTEVIRISCEKTCWSFADFFIGPETFIRLPEACSETGDRYCFHVRSVGPEGFLEATRKWSRGLFVVIS